MDLDRTEDDPERECCCEYEEDEEGDVDSSSSPIGMLPNEVLGHIFGLLEYDSNLPLVSRHWRDVYDDFYVLQPRVDGYYCFPEMYTTDFFKTIERRYEKRKAAIPAGRIAKELLEFAIARGRSKLVNLMLEDDTKTTFDVEGELLRSHQPVWFRFTHKRSQ